MSTIQNIAKNTFLLISANIISLVLGLVLTFYTAQYLGVEQFGIINAALNLATLFTYVADMGISTYLIMHISRHNDDYQAFVSSSLSLRLMLITGSYVLLLAIALLTGDYVGNKMIVLVIIGIYVMLTALSQLFQAVFQAFQSMGHIAVCQLLNPVILTLGLAYVILNQLDVVAYALVYLVSGAVILVYNIIIIIRSYSMVRPRLNLKLWKVLVLGGIPFSISSILYYLNFKIDIQLIDMFLGSVSVGYYSAAFKFVEAIICIPILYATAVFPIISLYYHKNNPDLHLLLEKSFKYLYMLGVPIAIGAFLCADQLILFFYKDGYLPSIPVLQGLSIGILLIFVNSIASTVLQATNMQKATVVSSTIAAVINIGLNIVIIPVYGIVGSAYTMAITQSALFVMVFYLYIKAGYRLPKMDEMLKVTLCGAIMGAFVYLIQDLNVFVIIALAAAVYFALLLISRTITNGDISLISSIFLKKKA